MRSSSLSGLAAAAVLAACQGSAPLTGPSQPCTSFVNDYTFPETSDDAGDASDGLVVDVAETCLPFPASEVDSGLVTCSVFVTLGAPGDESMCESAGLVTPDPVDLGQIRVAYGDAGFGSTNPTCLVPQLVGAALDDAGSCFSSQAIGWCFVPSGACGMLARLPVFSPAVPTNGAHVVIACAACGG